MAFKLLLAFDGASHAGLAPTGLTGRIWQKAQSTPQNCLLSKIGGISNAQINSLTALHYITWDPLRLSVPRPRV